VKLRERGERGKEGGRERERDSKLASLQIIQTFHSDKVFFTNSCLTE
jgi:hypothetical protein